MGSKLILLISLAILMVLSSLSSSFANDEPSPHSNHALILLNNWGFIGIFPFSPIFITFFILIFVGLAKLDIQDLSIFISCGLDFIL